MRKRGRPIDSKSPQKKRKKNFRRKGLRIPNQVGPGSFSLANRIPAQRHRSLPFSLSLCNGWEGSRRSEAYRPADHQIRDWAPSPKLDGMAHPTQERLCHMGTHGCKQSLWF